jgi:ribosomal protein S18 acetylase RimI-like enzyme
VRVWRAAPDEAQAVAALLGGFRDHLGYTAPCDASLLASVERIIARDDAEYLLAADGDEPQGVVQVRYRWSVWWEAEDCWLEDLYVRDDARGKGLGRALTEAVLERARRRGCRRVELDVNSENPPALALYRSLGFDTGKTGGQDILMRRRL